MIGKGKYDAECEDVIRKVHADGVLLIVLGGSLGNGFSSSFVDRVVADGAVQKIPGVLREVADQIEADFKTLSNA